METSQLPPKLLKQVLDQLDTGMLLPCRSVSSVWNKVVTDLLHQRQVSLVKDWYKKENGMDIFGIYVGEESKPWSCCSFPVVIYKTVSLRQYFLSSLGSSIRKCHFDEDTVGSDLFEILQLMPNLVELILPPISSSLEPPPCPPQGFKLYHLKVIRFHFSSIQHHNEDHLRRILKVTMADTLKTVSIENFQLKQSVKLQRMCMLLQHVPRLVLSVGFQDNHYCLNLTDVKLNIVELKVSCVMPICLCDSLGQLERLSTTVFATSRARRSLFLKLPTLPSLTHLFIKIIGWNRVDDIYTSPALLPNLKSLTISTRKGRMKFAEVLLPLVAGGQDTVSLRHFSFPTSTSGIRRQRLIIISQM